MSKAVTHTLMRCECAAFGGCASLHSRRPGAGWPGWYWQEDCEREGDALQDVGWRVRLRTTEHVSLWPTTPLDQLVLEMLADPDQEALLDEVYERDEDGVFVALCPECARTTTLEW